MGYVVSEDVLRHIARRHGRDFRRMLGVGRLDLLRGLLEGALAGPDEVRLDAHNPSVRYFLKRVDGLWLTIVLLDDEVRTAYLISSRTYRRLAARRWM